MDLLQRADHSREDTIILADFLLGPDPKKRCSAYGTVTASLAQRRRLVSDPLVNFYRLNKNITTQLMFYVICVAHSPCELHLTLTYLVSGIAIKVLKLRKRLSGKIHV